MQNILNKYNYIQKQDFLIDVYGYSLEDLEELGEIGLDNIIIDNSYHLELKAFYS